MKMSLAELATRVQAAQPRKPSETQRCVDLPKVEFYPEASGMQALLRKPYGTMTLNEVQCNTFAAINRCKGFAGPIGVGWGKSLIAYGAGAVLNVDMTVILVPSAMVGSFMKEVAKYKHHFRGPRRFKVISYETLSDVKGTDLLERLKPNLIVADEAHKLRHPDSVRTRRFLRYMDEHPDVMFVAVSGTLTNKGLEDYAHLLKYALRHNSPLPRGGQALKSWAACVDARGRPSPSDWAEIRPLVREFMNLDIDSCIGETRTSVVREALFMRTMSAEGVVGTTSGSCQSTLSIQALDLDIPAEILDAMKAVSETNASVDGEEYYEDDISKWRALRQLSCGFYYRWAWEQVGGRDEEWLEKRKEWHRFLRDELGKNAEVGYDSPALIARKLASDIQDDPSILRDSDLHYVYNEWCGVKDRPKPPTVPVWVSSYFIDDCVARLTRAKSHTILWYESEAVAIALAERGVRVYGRDTEMPAKSESCAASIRVHGTGKNLQAWSHNLIAEMPSSGSTSEQLLGRTHRQGQDADEVKFYIYQHTESFQKALEKAVEEAKYIRDTTGNRQKLLDATWV